MDVKIDNKTDIIEAAKKRLQENYEENKTMAATRAIERIQDLQKHIDAYVEMLEELQKAATLGTVMTSYNAIMDYIPFDTH